MVLYSNESAKEIFVDKDNLTAIALVFCIINATVILGAILYAVISRAKKRLRQNKVDHFGDDAEKKVLQYLKKAFPKACIMDSVYLKTAGGLTEIDMLMICSRGIFIIEVKSHNGHITTNGKFWTQRWKDKIVRFYNPVYQNNAHRSALEGVFRKRQSLASLPIYTVTVFTSPKVTFSKNVKDVIKLSALTSYVKRKKPSRRMTGEMIRNVKEFISSNAVTSRIKQNRHKRKIYNSNSKKRAYRFNR